MMGELIRLSGRTPDVAEFLREAMLSQRFADVALCCPGGQRFLAHRLVLSAASPYLQEVLLAHSRSAGLCEPITVILAEVESPELAAILGLIYTGNASVARPRLDAFLRAAQTLRVKLPPLPEMMSCIEDCKPEDIKYLKFNTTYLQCDQYPLLSYRSWFQEHETGIESYNSYDVRQNPDLKLQETSEGLRVYPKESKVDHSLLKTTNHVDNGAFKRPEKLEASLAARYNLHNQSDIDGNQKPMKHLVAEPTSPGITDLNKGVDTCQEAKAMDLCKIPRNVTTNVPHTEADGGLGGQRFGDDHMDVETPLKNCSANYPLHRSIEDAEKRINLPDTSLCQPIHPDDVRRASPPDDGHRFHLPESDQRVNLERIYEAPSKILGSLFDLRVPSLHQTSNPESITHEKFSYGQGDVDSECKGSCCRWRPPRKHVANHVTASPWRQLTRPHHSPKMQPTMLRSHHDNCEPSGRLQRLLSTNVTQMETTVSSACQPVMNDLMPRLAGNSGDFQAFEVPNTTNIAYPNGIELLRKERKLQEFYRAQILFPGPQPIRPAPVSFGVNQNYYHSQNSPPTLPTPSVTTHSNAVPITLKSIQPHQTVEVVQNCPPAPSSKPELSHPVSRLCDSTRSTEPAINHSPNLTINVDEEPRIFCNLGDKMISPLAQSDSNNNNPSVTDGGQGGSLTGTGVTADDHRCEECGKTFVTRASLKVHARTHSGEKPFKCTDCGKQFSQLRNYKYHRSVHEGTREFAATCPECGKYFNDRGYLSSHMKIHRNRKEYACAECGKSFNQRVAYNMHVRIHTGVKPHRCEQCGKAFSRKMLLKQHLRTHSGERPYQCQVCHKAFADRSNMTLHTRLHSGLKPYQCTLCSKAFTKKHHLKTHLNYHTGTKPYSCPNCELRFSQSSNMRTHFKKCAVNNPSSNQMGPTGVKGTGQSPREIEGLTTLNRVGPRTPSVALTPPNSDQESSTLTPLSSRSLTSVQMTRT